MKDIKAKILFNGEVSPGYFKMALGCPRIARSAKPGQFVQIKCTDTLDPLLRRPLSVHRLKAQGSRLEGIEVLYEVVGKGTEILSKRKKGEFINILGPLGNGFALPPFTLNPSPLTLLVAGGIGVAPLVFLAEKLVKQKIKTIVLIGAKTKDLILCEKDFKKIEAEVHTSTDDGTKGYNGFVSKLFEKVLRTTNHEPRLSAAVRRRWTKAEITIYACGPHPMLRSIAEISKKRKIECQVLLEEKMACGIGACLGCAVKVTGKGLGYKLACKDGPVFDAGEIVWE